MSNYKHGDWYCKPANEDEAKEIVARALVSGAVLYQSVGDGADKYRWDLREYWGVVSGYTINLHNVLYVNCPLYTIEQIREKFPLPSERQVNVGPHLEHEQKEVVRSDVNVSVGSKPVQWDDKGFPLVGVECEFYREDVNRWVGCETIGMFRNEMVCAPDGGGFLAGKAENFRPIRSKRERWIENALDVLQKDPSAMPNQLMGMIYDALKSGNLKAPEVE